MSNFEMLVCKLFDQLKCKSKNDLLIKIPIYNNKNENIAFLRPIIKDYLTIDKKLPELLTRWRIENPTISTGVFKATPERTIKWLNDHIINRKDRILFLIESIDEILLGHIGLSNFNYMEKWCEIDSVLRGEKKICPGLMTNSTVAIIKWSFNELKLNCIKLSVFSDNFHAIKFYERLGFKECDRKPLYKVYLDDEVKLEVAPQNFNGVIEKYYIQMSLNFNDLFFK